MRIYHVLLISLLFAGAAHAVTLVEDGQPRAALVLPAEALPDHVRAAEEIREHLAMMSGAQLQIVEHGRAPADLIPIHLRAEPDAQVVRQFNGNPHSFALDVSDAAVVIQAATPRGVLFGAYELLEQLGVRWYHPGELGRVVPESATVRLAAQHTLQTPSFDGRTLQAVGDRRWADRMRLGGKPVAGAHGIPPFHQTNRARTLFESHPEYFSLVNGERRRQQLCLSNPVVLDMAIEAARDRFRSNPNAETLNLGPNDGGGFCECDRCAALDADDRDPFFNAVSMTDRYVWFFNQILEAIEDEFPDAQLGFYAYHAYQRPPVNVQPHRGIRVSVAPIGLCRVHGPNNPVCPEQQQYAWLIEKWGELLPEVFERGYWFNLACPGLPFVMIHRIREQVPMVHALGLRRWRVETLPKWASESPSLYVAARLMWDHTADVDAMLADFFTNYYGPAAEPMSRYIMMFDAALRDADHHTGSSWDMPNCYPPELRRRGRALLDEAEQLAEGVHRTRVQINRKAFDMLDAFIDMMEHRTAHDYIASQRALNRVDALIEDLNTSYDIPMLHPRLTTEYLNRFFRQTTEQAYARVTDGNEFIVGLDDLWQFQIDPQRVGLGIGLHRTEVRGGNWQSIRASQSWSNQGLRYYKGDAWFRQVVRLPEAFADRRVFLWFAGVDELAAVWLNGRPLGASHDATFLPFELDATAALQPGENVLVVRVTNARVDELGTGGLTGPVMFYAPAAGEDADPDNVRDTRRLLPGGAVE